MFTVCLVEGTKQPYPFMGWGLFCTCKPGESEEVYPWAIAFPWEIRIIRKIPVCSHTLTYDLSLIILHFTSHLCVYVFKPFVPFDGMCSLLLPLYISMVCL